MPDRFDTILDEVREYKPLNKETTTPDRTPSTESFDAILEEAKGMKPSTTETSTASGSPSLAAASLSKFPSKDELRRIAQGTTFGFADEIEAGLRAPFSSSNLR